MYFLLPNKTTHTYKEMLKMFKSKTSGIFDLKGITIDFECAMIKALVIPYPLIDIHCCRFHLAKIGWTKKKKK